jgi:hypothetical protein
MSEESKFIQDFQTKLSKMSESNSIVNQKILSELQDIQGKVKNVLENIKSLQRKIVECTQKTNSLKQQIQQNQQGIQTLSSASPPNTDQIAVLQKENEQLKQEISKISQTKQQAIDAIQNSIMVLDKYRNSSDADVTSIKGLIDEIKVALTNASTTATTSDESGGLLSGLAALFGSTAPVAPVAAASPVPSGQQQIPLLGPSELEKARAVATEDQRKRQEEEARKIEQQILRDGQMAKGIANFQQDQNERQKIRDEEMARNLQRQEQELRTNEPRRGGKKTRKSKKRRGTTKKNNSKRRGKNKKHSPKKH